MEDAPRGHWQSRAVCEPLSVTRVMHFVWFPSCLWQEGKCGPRDSSIISFFICQLLDVPGLSFKCCRGAKFANLKCVPLAGGVLEAVYF